MSTVLMWKGVTEGQARMSRVWPGTTGHMAAAPHRRVQEMCAVSRVYRVLAVCLPGVSFALARVHIHCTTGTGQMRNGVKCELEAKPSDSVLCSIHIFANFCNFPMISK